MARYNVIYRERGDICASFRPGNDLLEYEMELVIRDGGKRPVSVALNKTSVPPFTAPDMPKTKTLDGESVADVMSKVFRLINRAGYRVT